MATDKFHNVPLTPQESVDPTSPSVDKKPRRFVWNDSTVRTTTWYNVSSEWICTFLYMYLSLGTVLACGVCPDSKIHSTSTLLAAGLSNGLALSAGIALGASHGGGQCNPAVTFCYVLAGRMSILRAALNVLAQVTASLAAGGLIMLAFPVSLSNERFYIHSPEQAFLIEAISASLLTATTLTLRPKKGPQNPAAPVIIGFFLTANIIATSHFADGAANPARSLALAITTARWRNAWIRLSSPFVGAIFGAVCHEFLIDNRGESN